MLASVEHIKGGYWQPAAVNPSQILVERHLRRSCRRLGHGNGYPQNGIGSQIGFIGSCIQLDHELIYLPLGGGIHA